MGAQSANGMNGEKSSNSADVGQTDPLLRLPDVLKMVRISRSAWFAGVKAGRYPQPVRLSRRTVFWHRSAVQKLMGLSPCL